MFPCFIHLQQKIHLLELQVDSPTDAAIVLQLPCDTAVALFEPDAWPLYKEAFPLPLKLNNVSALSSTEVAAFSRNTT